jgi:Fe-S cluster assembly protein SufD
MVTMLVEGADCNVSGDVQIFPDIIKAEGRLLEENIVLGKKIKIHTLPKLDVRSNDVSASHGARIEKLDEKKLFYLESKGISKQDAKRLMLEGYVTTMFEKMVISNQQQVTGIEEMKKEVMGRVLG